jgi:hypothetical protein
VARFFQGFIGPFASQRRRLSVTTFWNPSGDWQQAYVLAHPRNPGAELVCDFHSKLLNGATGTFDYFITVRNASPVGTFFDIDF